MVNALNIGFMPYLVAGSQIPGIAILAITIAWLAHYRGALLVYRVFRNETKRSTKILHGALHIMALLISLVGIIAVFSSTKPMGIQILYSLHSWCGITTFSLYILQVGGHKLLLLRFKFK
ncbi:hypothetical protein XELAEV_18046095mg [Xenopus laevis]|uniref:Transmembrane ascorbate-dependent reductase CYB561 n=1 Tax=Xenopus laevis TaxID=8355 RepID=A0A974BSZ9_XENLA|nr:hypothetical protein XELAEV_18046095mg [Xenopus laevis]